MRAESSILELVETADGVAIAAPVGEIAVWCQAALTINGRCIHPEHAKRFARALMRDGTIHEPEPVS